MKGLAGGWTLLILCELCQAQRAMIPSVVHHDLDDGRWQVRRNAFEMVAANPLVTTDPLLGSLLIQLRMRENSESEKPVPDLYEDDDYVAYDEELTNLVEQIAINGNSPRAWKALVWMRYNPDSQTGRWLSEHKEALPYILELVRSSSSARRMNAGYLLALILSNSKSNLNLRPAKYQSLKAIIRSLALKDDPPVQQFASRGLALIGDCEDIPILERVAVRAKDPFTRGFALDAAKQIQKSNEGCQVSSRLSP
jgi:hypothetical protein